MAQLCAAAALSAERLPKGLCHVAGTEPGGGVRGYGAVVNPLGLQINRVKEGVRGELLGGAKGCRQAACRAFVLSATSSGEIKSRLGGEGETSREASMVVTRSRAAFDC